MGAYFFFLEFCYGDIIFKANFRSRRLKVFRKIEVIIVFIYCCYFCLASTISLPTPSCVAFESFLVFIDEVGLGPHPVPTEALVTPFASFLLNFAVTQWSVKVFLIPWFTIFLPYFARSDFGA